MLNDFQDIYLNSLDKELLVVISGHGTIWFVSNESEILEGIGFYLDKNGATVIKSDNF
jgi:mannose-6-phosphate isomerase-like protein (cupin superfamily)